MSILYVDNNVLPVSSDQIHNPAAYVRDYYFFKRSQYPQLELIHMKPEDAFNALQRQELVHKFVEIGKVLLTWAILKNVDMVVQRVVFLHEELMKLPSFPRKALESDLDLYKGGEIGRVRTTFNIKSFQKIMHNYYGVPNFFVFFSPENISKMWI